MAQKHETTKKREPQRSALLEKARTQLEAKPRTQLEAKRGKLSVSPEEAVQILSVFGPAPLISAIGATGSFGPVGHGWRLTRPEHLNVGHIVEPRFHLGSLEYPLPAIWDESLRAVYEHYMKGLALFPEREALEGAGKKAASDEKPLPTTKEVDTALSAFKPASTDEWSKLQRKYKNASFYSFDPKYETFNLNEDGDLSGQVGVLISYPHRFRSGRIEDVSHTIPGRVTITRGVFGKGETSAVTNFTMIV